MHKPDYTVLVDLKDDNHNRNAICSQLWNLIESSMTSFSVG